MNIALDRSVITFHGSAKTPQSPQGRRTAHCRGQHQVGIILHHRGLPYGKGYSPPLSLVCPTAFLRRSGPWTRQAFQKRLGGYTRVRSVTRGRPQYSGCLLPALHGSSNRDHVAPPWSHEAQALRQEGRRTPHERAGVGMRRAIRAPRCLLQTLGDRRGCGNGGRARYASWSSATMRWARTTTSPRGG